VADGRGRHGALEHGCTCVLGAEQARLGHGLASDLGRLLLVLVEGNVAHECCNRGLGSRCDCIIKFFFGGGGGSTRGGIGTRGKKNVPNLGTFGRAAGVATEPTSLTLLLATADSAAFSKANMVLFTRGKGLSTSTSGMGTLLY